MNEYVKSAKDFIADTTQKVVEKSGTIYSTTKLSLKISKLKGKIDSNYKKIGEIVYSNYAGMDVEADDAETLCAEIKAMYDEIDEISAEIAKLKGSIVCDVCGAEVQKGNSFCAKCGKEI